MVQCLPTAKATMFNLPSYNPWILKTNFCERWVFHSVSCYAYCVLLLIRKSSGLCWLATCIRIMSTRMCSSSLTRARSTLWQAPFMPKTRKSPLLPPFVMTRSLPCTEPLWKKRLKLWDSLLVTFILMISQRVQLYPSSPLVVQENLVGSVQHCDYIALNSGCVAGTNDKAGAPTYLLKFASPQSVKTTSQPLTEWTYPYMSS
jgi:hypothetical protein